MSSYYCVCACFFFFKRVLLHNLDWPGTNSATRAGIGFSILLPQPAEIIDIHYHIWLC